MAEAVPWPEDELEEDTAFLEAVESGDMRTALTALRGLIAHELSGNRCQRCRSSMMKMGEISALAGKLMTVMQEIEALPDPEAGDDPLEAIQARGGLATVTNIRREESDHDLGCPTA